MDTTRNRTRLRTAPRLAVISFAALLASCASVRTPSPVRPAIYGSVTSEGEPVADLRIQFSPDPEDHACEKEVLDSRTDSEGRFAIPALWESSVKLIPGLGHHPGWRLCFTAGDAFHSWHTPESSRPETPLRITVQCDLSPDQGHLCQEISRIYPE